MKLKSDYVQKIESRCYELLIRLRYRLELEKPAIPMPNFEFALKLFNRGVDVNLLEEPDVELLFLSLVKNLIALVSLGEAGGDVELVLLDVYNAYLYYIGKAEMV